MIKATFVELIAATLSDMDDEITLPDPRPIKARPLQAMAQALLTG
ncbi:MAG TPA: hypothetical protein VLC08_03305 [Chitinolyticbacter sp.]|nr:hypothetical protein [Chitinolyticbacter sp.]